MQVLVRYAVQFPLIMKAKSVLVIGFLRLLADIADKVPLFDKICLWTVSCVFLHCCSSRLRLALAVLISPVHHGDWVLKEMVYSTAGGGRLSRRRESVASYIPRTASADLVAWSSNSGDAASS